MDGFGNDKQNYYFELFKLKDVWLNSENVKYRKCGI